MLGGFSQAVPQPWRLPLVAMTMHKRLLPLAALLAMGASLAVAAGPAQANFKVGMADQLG